MIQTIKINFTKIFKFNYATIIIYLFTNKNYAHEYYRLKIMKIQKIRKKNDNLREKCSQKRKIIKTLNLFNNLVNLS